MIFPNMLALYDALFNSWARREVRQTGYSNSSLDMTVNIVANMPITDEPKIAANDEGSGG